MAKTVLARQAELFALIGRLQSAQRDPEIADLRWHQLDAYAQAAHQAWIGDETLDDEYDDLVTAAMKALSGETSPEEDLFGDVSEAGPWMIDDLGDIPPGTESRP